MGITKSYSIYNTQNKNDSIFFRRNLFLSKNHFHVNVNVYWLLKGKNVQFCVPLKMCVFLLLPMECICFKNSGLCFTLKRIQNRSILIPYYRKLFHLFENCAQLIDLSVSFNRVYYISFGANSI